MCVHGVTYRVESVVWCVKSKSRSTAVRFELTRVTPIDFESIALTARPSCQTEGYATHTQSHTPHTTRQTQNQTNTHNHATTTTHKQHTKRNTPIHTNTPCTHSPPTPLLPVHHLHTKDTNSTTYRLPIAFRITLFTRLDAHLSVQDVPTYGLVFPLHKHTHFVAHPFVWKVKVSSPGRPTVRTRDPDAACALGDPLWAFGATGTTQSR